MCGVIEAEVGPTKYEVDLPFFFFGQAVEVKQYLGTEVTVVVKRNLQGELCWQTRRTGRCAPITAGSHSSALRPMQG